MDPAAIFNQAKEAHLQGRFADAARLYEQVLTFAPEHPETLHLRGAVEMSQGNCAAAAPWFERCIAAQPGHASAHLNLAAAYMALGQADRAAAAASSATVLNPASPGAHLTSAAALMRLGRFADAVAAFDRALPLTDDRPAAQVGRAEALLHLARAAEAAAACTEVLAARPGFPPALSIRIKAYDMLQRNAEAVADCDALIRLGGGDAETYLFRARAREALGNPAEALADNDKALALDPEIRFVAGDALHLAMKLCRWDGLQQRIATILARVQKGALAAQPFALLPVETTPVQQKAVAADYLAAVTGHIPYARPSPPSPGKLRIGYFSSDLREHPVGQLIVGLLENHDRAGFETFAFAFRGDARDPVRQRIAGAVDRLIDVSAMSDAQVAELARSLGLHIAVDVNGHTEGARAEIFARGAAPLQVNYLGFPGTMGAGPYDYIIADPVTVPPSHAAHFSEPIAALPVCYLPSDPARAGLALPALDRAQAGLPAGGFVFCCFNNAYKITPEMFAVWMRLLKGVPGSVLWLRDPGPAAGNLRSAAAAQGIDPARLVFTSRVSAAEHLARHRIAALFLDTYPYNAHTAASDALAMGLPLVTRCGETFTSRVAASLLTAAGAPELITTNAADYERLAMDLANAPARLAEMRYELAKAATGPLFDAARYARDMESAFQEMWRRHAAGEAPAGFAVGKEA